MQYPLRIALLEPSYVGIGERVVVSEGTAPAGATVIETKDGAGMDEGVCVVVWTTEVVLLSSGLAAPGATRDVVVFDVATAVPSESRLVVYRNVYDAVQTGQRRRRLRKSRYNMGSCSWHDVV